MVQFVDIWSPPPQKKTEWQTIVGCYQVSKVETIYPQVHYPQEQFRLNKA